MDTVSISDVIRTLEKRRREFGNIPVVTSTDPEGNSFYTLDKEQSFAVDDLSNPTALFIYPWALMDI